VCLVCNFAVPDKTFTADALNTVISHYHNCVFYRHVNASEILSVTICHVTDL